VKPVAVLVLPGGVSTLILAPLAAPLGTLTRIFVAESEVIVAGLPPMMTAVAPPRCCLDGHCRSHCPRRVNEVMVGPVTVTLWVVTMVVPSVLATVTVTVKSAGRLVLVGGCGDRAGGPGDRDGGCLHGFPSPQSTVAE